MFIVSVGHFTGSYSWSKPLLFLKYMAKLSSPIPPTNIVSSNHNLLQNMLTMQRKLILTLGQLCSCAWRLCKQSSESALLGTQSYVHLEG
jgi:hypothetical protein